jgi:hypothetical protein
MDIISEMYEEARFSDLTIVATHYDQERRFSVHKVVIAARCPLLEDKHREEFETGTIEIIQPIEAVAKVRVMNDLI